MEIERYREEVNNFRASVDAYEGPHFKKLYRSLTQRSGELQCDLDRIDHQQKDDIREEKRNLIRIVDEGMTCLREKVHPDGQPCKDCSVNVV
jgi:hypothetical protein